MKKFVFTLFLYLILLPVNAQPAENEFRYILDVIQHLKQTIHQQQNESAARKTLSHIKNAQPVVTDGQYKGHQIIHNNDISGLIGIDYQQGKVTIAVFSTPPLRVRHATRTYKAFRYLLGQQYQEIKHNHYDLGDKIVARVKKQARKVSIDVYMDK